MLTNNSTKIFQYVIAGVYLLLQPGIKRFVIIPLLINAFIFILLTSWAAHLLSNYWQEAPHQSWLTWLIVLFWLVVGLIAMIIYGYAFNLLTTVIAAPFYGFLAEKIEEKVTGEKAESEPIRELVLRTFKRELIKLWYFVSRGLLIFISLVALFFIPLIGSAASIVIGSLWSAWCMTVQYADYAADNHRVPFTIFRSQLWRSPIRSYSLGGLILLGCMIPIVNIFISPIAVAASTLYWCDKNANGQLQLNRFLGNR